MAEVPNNPSTARFAGLLRLLVVVAVLTTLSGCSIIQNFVPKSYDYVNQVKDELGIDTLGEIQMEQEIVADAFSDEKPTYIAIIAGDDLAATLETRLVEEGYNQIGEATWEKRFDNKKVVSIQVISVTPGDKVDLGGYENAEAEADGVSIFIQG